MEKITDWSMAEAMVLLNTVRNVEWGEEMWALESGDNPAFVRSNAMHALAEIIMVDPFNWNERKSQAIDLWIMNYLSNKGRDLAYTQRQRNHESLMEGINAFAAACSAD